MSEMLDPVERALERRIQNRQGTDRRSRVAHRHAPNLKPKPKSKPQPPERWQTRARKQQQERRLLAKPLLKGVT
jgi:hypothetical protein